MAKLAKHIIVSVIVGVIAFFVLSQVLPASTTGWTSPSLYGYVMQKDGTLLDGVRIIAVQGTKSATAWSHSGYYELFAPTAGTWAITWSKSGYDDTLKILELGVPGSGPGYRFDVIMTVTGQTPERPPDIKVYGTVTAMISGPISGASVFFRVPATQEILYSALTNSAGYYEMRVSTQRLNYEILVQKDGYKDARTVIYPMSSDMQVDFQLEANSVPLPIPMIGGIVAGAVSFVYLRRRGTQG